jgi:hypothetical protein
MSFQILTAVTVQTVVSGLSKYVVSEEHAVSIFRSILKIGEECSSEMLVSTPKDHMVLQLMRSHCEGM